MTHAVADYVWDFRVMKRKCVFSFYKNKSKNIIQNLFTINNRSDRRSLHIVLGNDEMRKRQTEVWPRGSDWNFPGVENYDKKPSVG